jgi:hypothetical protein
MQTAIILLVSLFVFLISYKLFETAAGTLSPLRLNTISYVFYIQIVVLTFIGSILVACHMVDQQYLISRASDKIKVLAWLGICYSMIAMPLSMIALNAAFNLRPKKAFNEYIARPVYFQQGPTLSKVALLVFSGISFLTLIYTIMYSDSVPLFTLLSGDKELAAKERVDVRYMFHGSVYIRNLFGYLMTPIVAYYSAIYAIEKKSFFYKLIFLGNALMAIFLLAFDTQKAPIVFFIFGFLIIWTLIRGGISRKRLMIFGALGLLLIAGGYSFTQGVNALDQLTNIGSSMWGRIFVSEYGGYVLSLEFFPDQIQNPTWFIGLPQAVVTAMGYPNIESARLIMMHINPEGVKAGHANLISSYYMGEAWANYGWFGLLLSPIIVGLVLQSVHIFLLKQPKHPLIIAFYALLTVRWLLSSGFVNFLYLKAILYPLIFYYLYKFILQVLRTKKGQSPATS